MKKDNIPEKLDDFLNKHCEIKSPAGGSAAGENRIYIFNTKDCILFMAEAYVQGMRNAIGQTEDVMMEAKKNSDFSELIMVYNWSAPEPGMDLIQIPETLVRQLSNEQAAVILRNLQRIQKDIEVGKSRRKTLKELFGGKVDINTVYALDGERQYFIKGIPSPSDRRGYAERYAELAATNALFDLPKALNAGLQIYLPEDMRGEHFIEGRRNFYKKMRYGSDVHTELLLTDEGAEIFIKVAEEIPTTGLRISKLFQQAILDPFGLSLKYYLGKHPLIKLPSKGKD